MPLSPRRIGPLVLILLVLISPPLLAQNESADFTVVGSGIVEPLMQALVSASDTSAKFNINVTGTTTGFSSFCAGEADMTMATRPIAADESSTCGDNGVAYVDLLLGQNIFAFISHSTDDFVACLTKDELTTIYAPSSVNEITNWNQVLTEGPQDLALTAYVPDEFSPQYAILDQLVEGDGVRADAVRQATVEDMIAAVSATPGSIGLVPLLDAQAAGSDIRILDLDAAAELQGCQPASAETSEDNLYPAVDKFYLYVNVARLDQTALADFLDFAVHAGDVVAAAHFTPMTDVTVQANEQTLASAKSGEVQVTTTDTGYHIDPIAAGQVAVGGSGEGVDLIRSSTTGLNAVASNISVSTEMDGVPSGFRRFCNGELDIVLSYRSLTDEEARNCQANNITPLTLPVGTRAVILVANGATDYLSCLTTAEISTVWAASTDSQPANWNEVNDSFPDNAMTLFSPRLGSIDADLMLILSSSPDSVQIERSDIQENNDPLYRAAATANVEGALTFMEWADYQQVLANNQANTSLVGVDGGSGCVAPDNTNIKDGTYPLTRSTDIVVNRSLLIRPYVQSLLWYTYSDNNLSSFENAGYTEVRISDLSAVRNTLLDTFNAVTAEAAQAALQPEATAEATAEATVESTP